jgi:2-oxoglutarate dehydrogenase E1 component
MNFWTEFQGPNAGYVLELYERFLQDPDSVDAQTRDFFENWQPPAPPVAGDVSAPATAPAEQPRQESAGLEKVVALVNLARSIRHYGHLAAQLDPLGGSPPGDPSLDPAYFGLSEDNLKRLPAWPVDGAASQGAANAAEAVDRLRRVYCASTGFDYGQVQDEEERVWLRDAAEQGKFRKPMDQQRSHKLLERLTQIDAFERFLQRTFPGKTRFSIEGVDMLVPVLDVVIRDATADGVCMAFLGMAHRGRLNVLAHILDKPYEAILAEFRDPGGNNNAWNELGWTGDVKYHAGAQHALSEDSVVALVIAMPPNPSHLEFVDPVVEGMARAADTVLDQPGKGRFYPKASLPILIHGDAAFPGQGIVAETLNMSGLEGYTTAGTIHIITNNQLGYTVPPAEGRSTLYASDLANRPSSIPSPHRGTPQTDWDLFVSRSPGVECSVGATPPADCGAE